MTACTVSPSTDRKATIERLRCVERRAVDGATVHEMTDGCALLDVIEQGEPTGAMSVELSGNEATITAAACIGAGAWDALDLVERALKKMGVESVSMLTRRPALAARLMSRGYVLHGAGGVYTAKRML